MLPTRRLPSAVLASTLALLTFAGCTDDDSDPPDDHVYSQTTSLIQYGSCSQLETDLEDNLIREVWANIDRWDENRGFGGIDGAEGDGAGGAGSPTGGGREEGVDYSGTNNQESGVDEADLVKTDGYHVYALNGNRLHIFGVPQFGDLAPESVTKIEGNPREMLLDKDSGRAVVFSMINVGGLPAGHPLRALTGVQQDSSWYWRSSSLSKMTVLDISDRTAPRLIREVYYEGWYQTARKIDTSIRVSTYSLIDRQEINGWWELLHASGNNKSWTKKEMKSRIRNLELRDLIPQMFERNANGQFTTHGLDQASCQSFYRPTDSHARGIASIISFDLLGTTMKFDADHVVSNWAQFYSSKDKIVLAEPSHDWWWYWWFNDDQDQLNVHVFDISQPGKSRYTGSGRVKGQLSDQFAIDEDNGEIRLATTTNINRWWWNWGGEDAVEPPPMESHVFVLEQAGANYQIAGQLDGLAIGERITASRFLGDKGYLVTFRQIDPLFTVDLSDKYNPTLAGELKIPGFSTYLHPLGTDKLLTIGVGGTDAGSNGRTTISTFNVGNFANPTLTATLPIEGEQGWGWSEAQNEHKAFQYFAPKKLLAVPQSTYDYTGGYYRYLSKLEMINVDETTGALSLRGSINHSQYYNSNQYWSNLQIRRSIFMGDFIYAVSDKAISVHRLNDLGQVTVQTLPGTLPNEYYWWW